MDDIERKLAPVVAEVRKRLGNFILAEDDQTLEGVVLKALRDRGGSLAHRRDVHERPDRGAPRAAARRRDRVPPRHRRARPCRIVGGAAPRDAGRDHPRERRDRGAGGPRADCGASHALAVLIDLDDGPDRIDFGGTICLAIATEAGVDSRRSRILGGREWVRLGAVEIGLDCLRR